MTFVERGNLNFYQLEQFVCIARCKSLSKATQELYISQPTLSQSLRKLEGEVGCPLFDRLGNRIVINDHGMVFLSYARQILKLKGEALDQLSNSHDSGSVLRVYTTIEPITQILLPSYLALSDSQRIIQTTLVSNSAKDDLLCDNIDLVIAANALPDRQGRITNVPMIEDELLVAVPPSCSLYDRDELLATDLDGIPFIMTTQSPDFITAYANSMLLRREIDINVIFGGDESSVFSGVSLGRHSDACYFTSSLYDWLGFSFRDHRLLHLSDFESTYTVYFSFLSSKEPLIREFADWTRQTLLCSTV